MSGLFTSVRIYHPLIINAYRPFCIPDWYRQWAVELPGADCRRKGVDAIGMIAVPSSLPAYPAAIYASWSCFGHGY